MLMTPLLAGAMPDEQNLQAGLENKKAASCSGFRMGNRAAGCHFRPYSFASSPFDDFADMKNSTRKIVCQPLSAPPLDGPPTMAEIAFRKGSKGSKGTRSSLLATRGAAARLAGAAALRPSFPTCHHPADPQFARIVGRQSPVNAGRRIKSPLFSVIAVFVQLDRS